MFCKIQSCHSLGIMGDRVQPLLVLALCAPSACTVKVIQCGVWILLTGCRLSNCSSSLGLFRPYLFTNFTLKQSYYSNCMYPPPFTIFLHSYPSYILILGSIRLVSHCFSSLRFLDIMLRSWFPFQVH